MITKKKGIAVVVLILLIGAAVWYNVQQSGSTDIWTGRVEPQVVPQYSLAGGQITEMHVQLGQTVAAGDVLAVIDSTQAQYAIAQQEQVVIQRQAAVDQLLSGADAAAVAQARSQVKIAQASYDNAQLAQISAEQELQRAAALLEVGGLSQQEYDQLAQATRTAKNNVTAAASQVEAAQQQVVQLSKSADEHQVKSAQAALAQAESQLAQLKENLSHYTIVASCNGTILSVNYTQGAMIAAGSDLVDITDQQQTYVLAYVPVDQLETVEYGQAASILVDDKTYPATVCYIDVKVQYTPKEFQTAVQRDQESVKIKLQLEDDIQLKLAQEVQVQLHQVEVEKA